jgi:hypothetical protein
MEESGENPFPEFTIFRPRSKPESSNTLVSSVSVSTNNVSVKRKEKKGGGEKKLRVA